MGALDELETFREATELVYAELIRGSDGSSTHIISKVEALNRTKSALAALGDLVENVQPAVVLARLEFAQRIYSMRHDYHIPKYSSDST